MHFTLDLNVSSFPAVPLLFIRYYRNDASASKQNYITSVKSLATFQKEKLIRKLIKMLLWSDYLVTQVAHFYIYEPLLSEKTRFDTFQQQ